MLQSELNISDNLQTFSIEHHTMEHEIHDMVYCGDADDWTTADNNEYIIDQLINQLEIH